MTMRPSTTDNLALPMTYPGFVFRSLRKEGHTAEALLAGTGLTEGHLMDPAFRCGFAPLGRLLLNAIEDAGDPHLGPRLALRFEPHYVGLPAYAAMNAARFADALDVLRRFFFLSFPAIDFAVLDRAAGCGPGEVALRLHPKIAVGDDLAYFVTTSALVACDGLCRAALRSERFAIRAETSVVEPAEWASVAETIPFPIQFEAQENRLVFPAELLDVALPGVDPLNHPRLVALCERFAAEEAVETTLADRVVALLDGDRSWGPTLREAAGTLGYSERGLRRKLACSGTSFRKLVNQAREARARTLLLTTSRPIQTIAYDLGFQTPSNFARSFKRWTGTTPKAFREERMSRENAGRN